MIIDAHAHLDERILSVDQIVERMVRHHVDKVALIPFMNDPLPETPKVLLAFMRTLMDSGAQRVAKAFHDRFYTDTGDLKLRGRIYKIYAKPDNELVAECIRKHPDKFLGWLFLNPRTAGDPLEELERYRTVPGFVGVKLHPHWHRYELSRALPIAQECERLGWPVLIHLGMGEAGHWQALAAACPKLRLIFAHAGFPTYSSEWNAMRDHKNVWVDVSSPYINESLVRRAVKALGAERVLYGTDAPYGFHEESGLYDYGVIRGWVDRLPIRAAEVDGILGRNIETLLDLHAG